jgi:hypothetical protein
MISGEKKLDTPPNPFKILFIIVTALDVMPRLAAPPSECRQAVAEGLTEAERGWAIPKPS